MTASQLRVLLDGPYADVRDMVREWLSRPGNAAAVDLPREEHRAQVLAWAEELAPEGGTAIGFPQRYGAAVFAQLVVGGENRGVHALLVPLRGARAKPGDEAAGRGSGEYQEHGRLGTRAPRPRQWRIPGARPAGHARSKAVIKAVNALCAELRPHAGMLVEAFGVPEPALADAQPVAAVTP